MINQYLDSAKAFLKTNSDGKLSKELGLSRAYVSQLRNGIRLPSDEVMLRLAELTNNSKEEALLDLAAARAASDGARDVYLRLKKLVLSAFLAFAFLGFSAPAHAAYFSVNMVKETYRPIYTLCD